MPQLQYEIDPSKPTIPWPTWQQKYFYEPYTYWYQKGTKRVFLLVDIDHGPFTPPGKDVAIMIEWGKTRNEGIRHPLASTPAKKGFDELVKTGELVNFIPKM